MSEKGLHTMTILHEACSRKYTENLPKTFRKSVESTFPIYFRTYSNTFKTETLSNVFERPGRISETVNKQSEQDTDGYSGDYKR